MRELFIYYRVDPAQALLLTEAVAEWHARLRVDYPGLTARLLRRADGPPGALQTWMETYAMDAGLGPDGIDDALAQRIAVDAAALLAGQIAGDRHVEVFHVPARVCR